MKYNSARQEVISENFANVDTPGYKRKDLAPLSFDNVLSNELKNVAPVKTNSKHLAGLDNSNQFEMLSSKNKVQLDMEALEMMKNTNSFSESSASYRKILSLIKEAIGNNGTN
ncbi:MAG: flagellar basal body protein [Rickettsiales bacterium]|nr:flagellar basal body protein [Rickettsiales bacterium]